MHTFCISLLKRQRDNYGEKRRTRGRKGKVRRRRIISKRKGELRGNGRAKERNLEFKRKAKDARGELR